MAEYSNLLAEIKSAIDSKKPNSIINQLSNKAEAKNEQVKNLISRLKGLSPDNSSIAEYSKQLSRNEENLKKYIDKFEYSQIPTIEKLYRELNGDLWRAANNLQYITKAVRLNTRKLEFMSLDRAVSSFESSIRSAHMVMIRIKKIDANDEILEYAGKKVAELEQEYKSMEEAINHVLTRPASIGERFQSLSKSISDFIEAIRDKFSEWGQKIRDYKPE